jgi:hypothetical protein
MLLTDQLEHGLGQEVLAGQRRRAITAAHIKLIAGNYFDATAAVPK